MILLHNSPSPKDGDFFVIDTNIWLPILGFGDDLSEHYKQYFDKIIRSENCKILISPLQLSEIFNRWLRFHAYKCFKRSKSQKKFSEYYKSIFRTSKDFVTTFNLLKEDLDNYMHKILIKELDEMSYELLTNFPVNHMDYNDNYIYLFARQHNAILVTDDGDFARLNVENIATYNRKLYKTYKDIIVPKKF